MTFAWDSENWNRDREERLENQQKYHEQINTFSDETGTSLQEWLASRAQHVASYPKCPQVLTGNQQEQAIGKTEKDKTLGSTTPESRCYLRDWLHSRERKVGPAREIAINLKAPFSRPTFVPDPSGPPCIPRPVSAACTHIASNTASSEASRTLLADSMRTPEKSKTEPIRLTGGQLFLALSRLVLEVNWDWFHSNRHSFDMSDITSDISQRWWNIICKVYEEYCKAASQGVDALMDLYQQSKSGDHVLNIEQTLLNPMMRFLIGYKSGHSGEERGKAALESLLLEGDFLAYVTDWCQDNGMEYPGGTGRTQDRLKEYAVSTLPAPEGGC
ncbi:hypothetical protein ONS95_010315 [Cadophora gregata]|uniref:uncharacterized protein n=1 Tax=Cadophora gregata TaxID=51156 RepID=UPI0026DDBE89|nr:uncharacterized protein ONS95_010315 [Cadophora gregata]KAK0122051.1 hypothetical protein ONS95_010315 [Cadophora gregata]KAK0127527.1 hypothetical protein ONS96_007061 [Cadophora gregata f. sp. sojae]